MALDRQGAEILGEADLEAEYLHFYIGVSEKSCFAAGVLGPEQQFQNALEPVFHRDAQAVDVLTGKFLNMTEQPEREVIDVLNDFQ